MIRYHQHQPDQHLLKAKAVKSERKEERMREIALPKVPIRTIITTTPDNFPLDSDGFWFHIMEEIVGYRNHVFESMALAPSKPKLVP